MSEPVVDGTHAKTGDYGAVISTIAGTGKCPFCPENFRYHRTPILLQIGGWSITENSWPYKHTKHHWLIIPDKHVTRIDELDAEDHSNVQRLVTWAIENYNVPGAALALRFGETKYTGATVCHLHYHLIVLDRDMGWFERIWRRLFRKPRYVTFPIG